MPTMTNLTAPSTVDRSPNSKNIVLRPKRKPGHPSLQITQGAQEARKEYPVAHSYLRESDRLHLSSDRRCRNQLSVLVERACFNGMHRKRVIWIMFINESHATAAQHPVKLAIERGMLIVRY